MSTLKEYWTVGELSEVTTWAVQTIYNKVNKKEIPFTKDGGLLFPIKEMRAFLASKTYMPTGPVPKPRYRKMQ